MRCLLVLSHLMSNDCELSTESVARCRLAIAKFYNTKYKFLITSGWAYRLDCTIPISEVMKEYIFKNSSIQKRSIISLTSSRDTVGDAYFCLEHFQNSPISELHVVTSDYHVDRAMLIFDNIFNGSVELKAFGAKSGSAKNSATLSHEAKSVKSFNRTFALTDFSNKSDIFTTLSTKHPFYNGEIHPKI